MPANPIRVEVREELEALIPVFMECRQQDLTEMLESLQTENFQQIAFMGHKLKGTAGSYGFRPLEQIGRELETAAKDQDLPGIQRLVAQYAETLGRIQVVLVN